MAKFEIAYTAINKNTNGIAVIIEALLLINKIYKTINKAERIKNVFLKTLIIDIEVKDAQDEILRLIKIDTGVV